MITVRQVAVLCLTVFAGSAWSDDFRKSNWGATPDDVLQQEEAEPLGREDHEKGGFYLVFSEQMFGQVAEIRYFFDPLCERLVVGSFSFAEPLSEGHFIGIIKTFGDIYGEGPPISNLNGGTSATWQDGETTIGLLHLPKGVEVPELADRPPTSITYWYRDAKPTSCDFGAD